MSTRWFVRLAGAFMAAAACTSLPALSADSGGASFGATDPGAVSCALLAEMHEKAPTATERQFYNWAQGYFAGRSAAVPAGAGRLLPDGGPGRRDAFRTLLDSCRSKPSTTYAAAVAALWAGGS